MNNSFFSWIKSYYTFPGTTMVSSSPTKRKAGDTRTPVDSPVKTPRRTARTPKATTTKEDEVVTTKRSMRTSKARKVESSDGEDFQARTPKRKGRTPKTPLIKNAELTKLGSRSKRSAQTPKSNGDAAKANGSDDTPKT